MGTALEQLDAALDAVAAERVAASDAVVLGRQRELERAHRKLTALRAANVGAMHGQGAVGYDGSGTTKQWLQVRGHLAPGEAWKLLEVAKFTPGFPEWGATLSAGEVTLEHVVVATGLAKAVGPERAAEAVDVLLDAAVRIDPSQLKHVAERIRAYLCPEEDGKPSPRDKAERGLWVSETFEGHGAVKGNTPPETTALWRTWFAARAVKADPEDDRSPAERRLDAVAALLWDDLSTGTAPMIGGEQPHLGVIVHADDLQSVPPVRDRRGRRVSEPIGFSGEDALAAAFAYLDDDLDPVAPGWVTDPDPIVPDWVTDPDVDLDAGASGIDWDTVLPDWAGTTQTTAAPPEPPDTIPDGPMPAAASPGTARPCTALTGTALTGTALTGTALAGTALHGTAAATALSGTGPGASPVSLGSSGTGSAGLAPPPDTWPEPALRARSGRPIEPGLAALAAVVINGRASRMPRPGTGGGTEWGGILPFDAIRRIACDAGIHRVVITPEDVPISTGRRNRVVSAPQRRVVVARDGGCRFHGCTQPPAWTQVHHVVHWADGGPTDLDNLLLLCHHHRVSRMRSEGAA